MTAKTGQWNMTTKTDRLVNGTWLPRQTGQRNMIPKTDWSMEYDRKHRLTGQRNMIPKTDWSVEHDRQDSLTGQWNMIPKTDSLVNGPWPLRLPSQSNITPKTDRLVTGPWLRSSHTYSRTSKDQEAGTWLNSHKTPTPLQDKETGQMTWCTSNPQLASHQQWYLPKTKLMTKLILHNRTLKVSHIKFILLQQNTWSLTHTLGTPYQKPQTKHACELCNKEKWQTDSNKSSKHSTGSHSNWIKRPFF